MLESLSDPQTWIALFTLSALEMVLGIDNIIFISILAGKLPAEQQDKARQIGLLLAMGMRILLLLSLSWIIGLTQPLFHVGTVEITGKSLILIAGGLFLLGKSTFEIHEKLEGEEGHGSTNVKATLRGVLIQIILLDIVFSLDSVITAVGLAEQLWVMIAAVMLAVGVMLYAAKPISDFVNEHPTLKILALSFLLLIGFSLVVEGLEFHIPKGYVYFAMGFSFFVELINMRIRSKPKNPVQLRKPYVEEPTGH
jgi:predicted tellurium resistance membrane protein TerC